MTTVDDILQSRIDTPVHLCNDTRRMTIEDRTSHPRIAQLTWGVDYYVRAITLPRHVAGASTANPDGTYNIYLNELLPIEWQWRAFIHELIHCEAGHLDEWKDLPLEVKEWEADNLRPYVAGTDAC